MYIYIYIHIICDILCVSTHFWPQYLYEDSICIPSQKNTHCKSMARLICVRVWLISATISLCLWRCLEYWGCPWAAQDPFLKNDFNGKWETWGHPHFETSYIQRNRNRTSALRLAVPPQHSSPPLFPEPAALSVQRTLGYHFLPNAWPCPRISACSGRLFPLQPDSAKSTWPAICCKIPFGSIGLWYMQFWFLLVLLFAHENPILIRNYIQDTQGAWNDSASPSPTPALSGYQSDHGTFSG